MILHLPGSLRTRAYSPISNSISTLRRCSNPGTPVMAIALALLLVLSGCSDNGGVGGASVSNTASAPENNTIAGSTGGTAAPVNTDSVNTAPANSTPENPDSTDQFDSNLNASNGLTFATGTDVQSQPRVAIDAHLDNGLNPTLADLQTRIFGPKCSVCHNGNGINLPASLNLSDINATFISLVDTASTEFPSLSLIAPGISTKSYLVRKIEGTQLVGEQMPLQGGPLSNDEIMTIKSWIDQGAKF